MLCATIHCVCSLQKRCAKHTIMVTKYVKKFKNFQLLNNLWHHCNAVINLCDLHNDKYLLWWLSGLGSGQAYMISQVQNHIGYQSPYDLHGFTMPHSWGMAWSHRWWNFIRKTIGWWSLNPCRDNDIFWQGI